MESIGFYLKQVLAVVLSASLMSAAVPPPSPGTISASPVRLDKPIPTLPAPPPLTKTTVAQSGAIAIQPKLRPQLELDGGRLVRRGTKGEGSIVSDLSKATTTGQAKDLAANRQFGAKIAALDPRGLSFIENKGQFDASVKFEAPHKGNTLWLTENAVVFDFLRSKPSQPDSLAPEVQRSDGRPTIPGTHKDQLPGQSALAEMERHIIPESFIGASKNVVVEARALQQGTYNYFLGSDPSKWQTQVRRFSEVIYHDLWKGVDLRLYGEGADLEQEFIVKRGADLGQICVAYKGVQELRVEEDGSLLIKAAAGQMSESAPRMFQEVSGRRVPVGGRFKLLTKTSYTFDVPTFDSRYSLVIDPTLLYSSYLGGSGTNTLSNTISGMAVDSSGSTYVAGFTNSQDFPVTSGTLQSGFNTFVTKLNASGSALVYSSILGRGIPFFSSGSVDRGGLAVDNQGNAYVTGLGANMPTTANAYSACSSGFDGFLTVLGPAGNQLVYSTCLNSAAPIGLAVDSGGRAFLAGQSSCGLATTPNAFQPNCPSGNSGFLRVFDTTLSGAASLMYSSYLGDPSQSLNTYVGGIALDSFGKAYVTGQVYSATSNTGQFPTTPGAYRTTLAACTPTPSGQNQSFCQWPFIAKFDATAQGPNSLIYSTYIGYAGQSTMTGDGIPFTMPLNMGIAVDQSGNAYITGGAGSTYPTTPGAFQTTGSGTFVTKLNASGSNVVYSTFLPTNTYPFGGGTALYTSPFNLFPPTIGFPIAVDASGQVYISGNTSATNYPVTADAFQSKLGDSSILGGGGDAFLTILNSAGSGLVYSSYLGGGGADEAIAVTVDQIGDVYVAGQTKSPDFPVTASAYQASIKGTSSNLFISKFPLASSQSLSVSSITPTSGGNAGTVTPQIFGTGFHAGAKAQLNCGSAIAGTNLTVGPGGRFLNTTFNLVGTPASTCDVAVTNPDGTSVTLSQAFAVQQGGAPNLQIYLTGMEERKVPPEVSLGPADAIVLATVSNTGNVDSDGLLVSEPVNSPFSLTSVSPQGITDLAGLAASSEAFWSTPSLAASSSKVFALTAGSQLSPPLGAASLLSSSQGAVGALSSSTGGSLTANACVIQDFQRQAYAFCVQTNACALCALTPCNASDAQKEQKACNDCGMAAANCSDGTSSCNTDIKTCLDDLSNFSSLVKIGIDNACMKGNCTSSQLPGVQPNDPNSLVGFPGVGTQGWIDGVQTLTYGVSFSNEPTATAPAQQVVVTVPLGTNVNLSTLSLPSITVPNGTSVIQALVPPSSFNPAAGVDEFTTNVDLRPSQSLLVSVDAKLNPSAQVLTWTFTSIDPTTGLPPLNPLVGFLPPGAGANLAFSVIPAQGVATGSQIAEQATIVFQGAGPMSTQVWTNTIDNAAPASQVQPLPAAENSLNFTVQWTGTDVGSGIQDFTIYVSDNGGPFAAFQTNTTATSATFMGQTGHTYGFYSIARDLVGNIEAPKTVAEATTQAGSNVDSIPPITTVATSPQSNTAGWNNSNVAVTLTAADNLGGSGVRQVTYSVAGAQLVPTTTVNGSSTSFVISTEGISTITFFSTDNAGNVEAPNTLTIRLDKTPPTVTPLRTPPPNANGWNNTNVTVSFQCADTLSGLAAGSPPAPTVFSAEGAGQSVTGTCTDLAGNSASATVSGINIDKTPPSVNCGAPDGVWHASDVIIACTASDAGSGLANPPDASFSLSTSVPTGTETSNAVTGTRSVCDVAGNCGTAGPVTGNMVDKKPPSINVSSPTAGGSYLLNQAVNANYACTDGGSGVATCTGTVASGSPISAAPVGSKTFTVNATDRVGNVAPSQSVSYSVTYAVCLLYDPTRAVQSGSTIPLKIQLCDANNADVSSSTAVVHGVSLVQTSTNSSEVLQASGNANPDNDFRFDPTLGPTGGYIFNLSTKGLTTGSYQLTFTAGADPLPHVLGFQVR